MINPVAFSIFGVDIYWYGIAYVISIFLSINYVKVIALKYRLLISPKSLDDYMIYLIVGILLGGRLGYVLFYNFEQYFNYPLEIFKIRNGGMSFHGGVIGVLISSFIFCVRYKISFIQLLDLIAIATPIGIFFGRIGNFINGELYGKITEVPWGVYFNNDNMNLRHPSQLYEAFLEGVFLFCILNLNLRSLSFKGYKAGIFLVYYSFFRIVCEYFREPDVQLGYILNSITMGQILSIPMLIIGILLIRISKCQLAKK